MSGLLPEEVDSRTLSLSEYRRQQPCPNALQGCVGPFDLVLRPLRPKHFPASHQMAPGLLRLFKQSLELLPRSLPRLGATCREDRPGPCPHGASSLAAWDGRSRRGRTNAV